VVKRKWTELPLPSEFILQLVEVLNDPNDSVERLITDIMEKSNKILDNWKKRKQSVVVRTGNER
jgi:hypothetical protein